MPHPAPQHDEPAPVSLLEPVLPGERRVVSWTRLTGNSLPLALAHASEAYGRTACRHHAEHAER
jgi:hypothetical protein